MRHVGILSVAASKIVVRQEIGGDYLGRKICIVCLVFKTEMIINGTNCKLFLLKTYVARLLGLRFCHKMSEKGKKYETID